MKEILNNPNEFFQILDTCFNKYYHAPSNEGFLLLVSLLYHLREQMVDGKKWENIKKIPSNERSSEERFFAKIYDLSEFKIIRDICNGFKHHKIEKEIIQSNGLRCGVADCGDSLGQESFMINGKDSRKLFLPVYKMYKNYFKQGDI